VVESDSTLAMNIIQHMHFECWVANSTDTHSECVIFIDFPRQQWLSERASLLDYTYIACLVFSVTVFTLLSNVQNLVDLCVSASDYVYELIYGIYVYI
jgi:hypothetical protein